MNERNELRSVDISRLQMVARGLLRLQYGGGGLFVADGIAYIAATSFGLGGYSTVDVTDIDLLKLIAPPATTQQSASREPHVVLNGSGLGIMTIGGAGGTIPSIAVLDTSDPLHANEVVLYPLPQPPKSVTLAGGIAYVAGGGGGVHIVDYRQYDATGIPPEVDLSLDQIDVDPDAAGIQVVEGTTVHLAPEIRDNVQTRSVELLLNGEVVQTALAYPFGFSLQVPAFDVNNPIVTLTIRATDTGGSSTVSDPVVLETLQDTTGPSIASQLLWLRASLLARTVNA